jgi:hypothetical protein
LCFVVRGCSSHLLSLCVQDYFMHGVVHALL